MVASASLSTSSSRKGARNNDSNTCVSSTFSLTPQTPQRLDPRRPHPAPHTPGAAPHGTWLSFGSSAAYRRRLPQASSSHSRASTKHDEHVASGIAASLMRCPAERWRRLCVLGAITIVALPLCMAVLYMVAYLVVCNHCNRLGNFLDTWYARSLVDELARGFATDSVPCDHAKTIEEHTACEQGLWRHVVDELDRRAVGQSRLEGLKE